MLHVVREVHVVPEVHVVSEVHVVHVMSDLTVVQLPLFVWHRHENPELLPAWEVAQVVVSVCNEDEAGSLSGVNL